MGKTKSIVTEHEKMCFFCGRPAECEHHLLFGSGIRELAEQDGLKVPACNNCHNMGRTTERVHDNPMAEKLSKILGQAMYEAKIGSREDPKRDRGGSIFRFRTAGSRRIGSAKTLLQFRGVFDIA